MNKAPRKLPPRTDFLSEEYENKRELERKASLEQIHKRIKEKEEKRQKIIDEQYNGDRTAYFRDHFSLFYITFISGISVDEARNLLIKNMPDNEPRKKILFDNMGKLTLSERLAYPGTTTDFENDVKAGYFENKIDLDDYDDIL